MSDEAGTPAERLLYALGQLYRLHRAGDLQVAPAAFDILDLARIIGVSRDIEFVTTRSGRTSYHFANQVLVAEPAKPFPWAVLDDEWWALEEEAADLDLDLGL